MELQALLPAPRLERRRLDQAPLVRRGVAIALRVALREEAHEILDPGDGHRLGEVPGLAEPHVSRGERIRREVAEAREDAVEGEALSGPGGRREDRRANRPSRGVAVERHRVAVLGLVEEAAQIVLQGVDVGDGAVEEDLLAGEESRAAVRRGRDLVRHGQLDRERHALLDVRLLLRDEDEVGVGEDVCLEQVARLDAVLDGDDVPAGRMGREGDGELVVRRAVAPPEAVEGGGSEEEQEASAGPEQRLLLRLRRGRLAASAGRSRGFHRRGRSVPSGTR